MAAPPSMGTIAPNPNSGPNQVYENNPLVKLTPEQMQVPRMSSWDSIFRQSFWYAGFNPDKWLVQKRLDTFDDMLTMAACRSPLNVLLYGALRKGVTVEPGLDDPADSRSAEASKRADMLKWAIENVVDIAGNPQDMTQVFYAIGLGAWYGFSVTEIIYKLIEKGKASGTFGFDQFAQKPPQMIGWDLDKDTLAVRNIIPYSPGVGYGPPAPVAKFVRYTHDGTRNLPHGNGLARVSYKHWFSIDKLMQMRNVAAQRAGIVILGYYPPGNDAEMKACRDALDNLQASAVGAIPNNVKVEALTAAAGDILGGFKVCIDSDCEQIAQVVLGNTLTTGEGDRSGSMALGNVHQDTGDDMMGYVRGRLQTIGQSQIARRWYDANYEDDPDYELCPKMSLGEYDDADRQKKTEMYGTLIDKGVTHAKSKYIREDLKLPPMDPDEEKLFAEDKKREDEQAKQQADLKMQGKTKMSESERVRFMNALEEVMREAA